MKKGLSIVINIVLFAIIVLLAWQVVKSIQAPIKFNTEQKAREAQVIKRLIDIRNAEVLYKNANSKDSTYYTVYDTIGFIKVMDSIRGRRTDFNINDLKVVPFSQPKQNFELEAGTKESSGIKVPIFEARTPYEVYLAQPGAAFSEKEWKQRVDNLRAEKESIHRYPGLKVGSMEEASTEGNWEKL